MLPPENSPRAVETEALFEKLKQQVHAPFTPDQVDNLNSFQDVAPALAVVVCERHTGTALIANTAGWRCSQKKCHRTQTWAYAYVANGDWQALSRDAITEVDQMFKPLADGTATLADVKQIIDRVYGN